jgi:hypothetical protein
MNVNPGSVLLLDEPDAHLEILRQRQIYRLLSDAAERMESQVIATSHSEVVLNEAAGKDVVVAFVGKPHRIDDRGSHVLKSLRDIGFEHYYQAELQGWVLYLEGTTDLATLQAFAKKLNHPLAPYLEMPFVHYVENQPQKARDHFHGLREAKPDLVGFLLCDRLERALQPSAQLDERMWKRREIENYLCQRATLLEFARFQGRELYAGPLLEPLAQDFEQAMERSIEDLVPRVAQQNPADPYWVNTKVSDDLLNPLFSRFYEYLDLPNLMPKSNYHRLASHVAAGDIDGEVSEILDAILVQAKKASRPAD